MHSNRSAARRFSGRRPALFARIPAERAAARRSRRAAGKASRARRCRFVRFFASRESAPAGRAASTGALSRVEELYEPLGGGNVLGEPAAARGGFGILAPRLDLKCFVELRY